MNDLKNEAMVYHVPDWDETFENNKSRARDQCSFVCVPNKQHGMGFAYIMAEPDGAAVYGIWCMILGALSRQRKPRQGYLTDNGLPNGAAWTAHDMAMQFRRPVTEIERALSILINARVAWVELVPAKCPRGARRVPAKCPPSDSEENRREGIEEKGSHVSDDPSLNPLDSPSPPNGSAYPTLSETLAYAKNSAPVMITEQQATAWHENRSDRGWMTTVHGVLVPMKNWQANLASYVRSWNEKVAKENTIALERKRVAEQKAAEKRAREEAKAAKAEAKRKPASEPEPSPTMVTELPPANIENPFPAMFAERAERRRKHEEWLATPHDADEQSPYLA